MYNASTTLAQGRKTQNLLIISLILCLIVAIGSPIYYSVQAKRQDQIVVFDLASGSLLLSPVVDPGSSRTLLETMSIWVAQTIYNRSPAGFDNKILLPVLFNSATQRKIEDEFAKHKEEYRQKDVHSKIEIKSFEAQAIGDGKIKSRITGQIIYNAIVNGKSERQVKPITLDIDLAHNPHLGENRFYPLMCFGFEDNEFAVTQR